MIKHYAEMNLYNRRANNVRNTGQAFVIIAIPVVIMIICTWCYHYSVKELERLTQLNLSLRNEQALLEETIPLSAEVSGQGTKIVLTVQALNSVSQLHPGNIRIVQVEYQSEQILIQGACNNLSELAGYLEALQQTIPGYLWQSLFVKRESNENMLFSINLKER